VALGFDDNAILSPHIGNLDTIDSCNCFEKTIADLLRIYNFKPDIIVCDKHPNYESTKWALRQVNENTKKPQIIRVQHHHAHILSVLIEHQITEEVLGIVFDGTGYGDDGNIWGGEFFLSSLNGSKRVGHFKEFKLLGGDLAIKEPRRAALSLLFDNYGKDALDLDCHTTRSFSAAELLALFTAHQKNLNSPLTSSCGRLFDAVASLAGICQKQSYEGQTGLMMEGYYNKETVASYSFTINANGVVDCSKMVDEILRDSDPNRIVSRFFNTLVKIIFSYYMQYKRKTVLSGGVFQNKVLTKLILGKMPNVVLPVELPANDGSIALGQIGAAMM
jgi:hydrogenase maturation protein HypF